jgi:hypothetical protein
MVKAEPEFPVIGLNILTLGLHKTIQRARHVMGTSAEATPNIASMASREMLGAAIAGQ